MLEILAILLVHIRTLSQILFSGYDDVETVQYKTNYVLENNLGGAMIWEITMDEFTNTCGGGKNPLMTAISQIILRARV